MSDCQSQVVREVQEDPGHRLIQEILEIQEDPAYHCNLVALQDLNPCLCCLCSLPKEKKKETEKERVVNDPRMKDG